MTTKLTSPLKREIEIDGKFYKVVLDATGLKITEKGRRIGPEWTWVGLLKNSDGAAGGDSAAE